MPTASRPHSATRASRKASASRASPAVADRTTGRSRRSKARSRRRCVTAGFKGYNCNLELVGQCQGEGGNWSAATFTDSAGRSCAYHSTAAPTAANGTPIAGRTNPGVPVIDITDPTKPTRTTSLTTASMIGPWESLRVNPRRQILIADNGQNGGGGPEVDIYDVSGDCRSPQLLSSLAVGTGADGGIQPAQTPVGHEGNIAPDGLTYYIGDLRRAAAITRSTSPTRQSRSSSRHSPSPTSDSRRAPPSTGCRSATTATGCTV